MCIVCAFYMHSFHVECSKGWITVHSSPCYRYVRMCVYNITCKLILWRPIPWLETWSAWYCVTNSKRSTPPVPILLSKEWKSYILVHENSLVEWLFLGWKSIANIGSLSVKLHKSMHAIGSMYMYISACLFFIVCTVYWFIVSVCVCVCVSVCIHSFHCLCPLCEWVDLLHYI